jgi:hypothetical protein
MLKKNSSLAFLGIVLLLSGAVGGSVFAQMPGSKNYYTDVTAQVSLAPGFEGYRVYAYQNNPMTGYIGEKIANVVRQKTGQEAPAGSTKVGTINGYDIYVNDADFREGLKTLANLGPHAGGITAGGGHYHEPRTGKGPVVVTSHVQTDSSDSESNSDIA